jgi:hypothetical protein
MSRSCSGTLREPQCELDEAFLTAEAHSAQPMTPPESVDVLLADQAPGTRHQAPGTRQSYSARPDRHG